VNRFRKVIEAVCDWYCRVFGSEAAFAVSIAVGVLWLLPLFSMGFTRWNSGIGLAGNNVESTGEWFFGVATLVVASRVSSRQSADQERDRAAQAAQQQHNEEQSDRIEALEKAIREDQAQEIALLQQALGVTGGSE
jgi:hypothetical protein